MGTVGDIFGAGGLAVLLGKVADKIWPDPTERARQQVRLLELDRAGEFKQIDAMIEAGRQQAAVNQQEAAHGSIFVAGWRPFIGWVCGTSLAYTFVLQPLVQFLCVMNAVTFDPALLPVLNSGELMTVLLGMLGLGGLRTYEKFKGVEGSRTPSVLEKKK